MFGHQDNNSTDQNEQTSTTNDTPFSATTDPAQLSQPAPATGISSVSTPVPDTQTPVDNQGAQHPGATPADAKPKADIISPAGGFPQAMSSKEPVPPMGTMPPTMSPPRPTLSSDDDKLTEATNEDLVEVKQKALDELFPLIDKLDQTPAEHFKTLMMIIQASDNHTLIEKAYEIAQTIDDEKSRAQALLDIVNEINYFTQQPEV